MTEMIIEAVVVALCVGGALGAVVTLHLQSGFKKQQVSAETRQLGERG